MNPIDREAFKTIAMEVCLYFTPKLPAESGVMSLERIRSRRRDKITDDARKILIWQLVDRGFRAVEVAALLDRGDRSTINYALRDLRYWLAIGDHGYGQDVRFTDLRIARALADKGEEYEREYRRRTPSPASAEAARRGLPQAPAPQYAS